LMRRAVPSIALGVAASAFAWSRSAMAEGWDDSSNTEWGEAENWNGSRVPTHH
jgi:hypothetical protein